MKKHIVLIICTLTLSNTITCQWQEEETINDPELTRLVFECLVPNCNTCIENASTRSTPGISWKKLMEMDILDFHELTCQIQAQCPQCCHEVETQNEPTRGYVDLGPIGFVPDNLKVLPLFNLGLTALPAGIAQLQSLETVILDGNNIQLNGLDALIGLPRLKVLDLTNNNMTALPTALGSLTTLTGLNLKNNNLGSADLSSLGTLTELRFLKLDKNGLTVLPECLSNFTKLILFHAEDNQLTHITMDSMQYLPRVTMIRLSRNNLVSLPTSMAHLTQLRMVFLDDNNLLTYALEQLQSIHIPPRLSVLRACRNGLSSLPQDMSPLSPVQWLFLDGNNLNSEAIKPIKALVNLEKLSLARNDLTYTPTEFAVFNKLKTIDLSQNYIQVDESTVINNQNMPDLYKLKILGCGLTNLPTQIISHPKLHEIRAMGNDFSATTKTALQNYGFAERGSRPGFWEKL